MDCWCSLACLVNVVGCVVYAKHVDSLPGWWGPAASTMMSPCQSQDDGI